MACSPLPVACGWAVRFAPPANKALQLTHRRAGPCESPQPVAARFGVHSAGARRSGRGTFPGARQLNSVSVGRQLVQVRSAIVLAVVVLAGCRSDVKPATTILDWSAIAGDQMILVVTTKADGEPRTTRLWLVVLDGSGYLRTSDTPWSHDIERDPTFLLLARGVSYPVTAARVTYGTDEHTRVMEAFGEKYGLLGRTVLAFYSLIGRYSGPADAKIFRLTARPPVADQGAGADALWPNRPTGIGAHTAPHPGPHRAA